MTYDSTTQAQASGTVTIDGEELKIGDEVIIARCPEDPTNDALWNSYMVLCVGRPGAVEGLPNSPGDFKDYSSPVIRVRVRLENGETQAWWFRLSELSRVHTYHQHAQPTDTPTEFPNLVTTNETTGPGALHPAVRNSLASPYNAAWLVNERRLCPYDETHGTLSLRPGYDAYCTQVEFEHAQNRARRRFIEWREARECKRSDLRRQIRRQLNTHPFANTKKGIINWRLCGAFDRNYYNQTFRDQHRDGRAAAKIIGRLVGHFHPAPDKRRALPDDEVFALLRSTLTHTVPFQVRDAFYSRTDQAGAAYRAYREALRKLTYHHEWQQVPWHVSNWFCDNSTATNRLPHISTVNPQEVAYYQSIDKLIRGIETRTKPGRFLTKFFPNLTPDQVRTYANDYLVATAPKQLHFARTRDEMITAIDEGPSESCQTRGYYDKNPDDRPWFNGHIHPAACYASGDFEVAYITDDNKPADLASLHAGKQRITARAICNAKHKQVARIYGDSAKMLPLLTSAGYEQVERALVGCRLLKIENMNGSGWIMPYVDAGIGSGGGSLEVDDYYDHDSGREYWMLVRAGNGTYSTYEGYDKKGVLEGEDEESYTCERCGETHSDEDDIHYSEYEETQYCSGCEGDFVYAVTSRGRYGVNRDMVLIDNAIEIGDVWYVNDDDLLERCGFVQCTHCEEWTNIDDTTTTDSGQVCDNCSDQVVPLAEESPDGNQYGYRPDCAQYVNTETGETVWLDDNSDVEEFTREDDEGEEVPMYVSSSEWERMQGKAQDKYDFQGPPERSPEPYTPAPVTAYDPIPRLSDIVFDDLRI